MGDLPNNYGRPKFVNRFKSMFDYFQNHVLPEKHKLIKFKDEEVKKQREWKKAVGMVNIQNQKVERAYEWLEYFKK